MKRLFTKLFLYHVCVMVVAFALCFALLFGMLRPYVTDRREQALLVEAEELRQTATYVLQLGGETALELFQRQLDTYAYTNQTAVFLTNREGKVLFASRLNKMPRVGDTLPPNTYEKVLEGETLRQLGTFGGVFDRVSLTVGLPLIMGTEVVGGVFLAVATPELNHLLYDILRFFLLAIAAALLVAFVAWYTTCRQVLRPIRRMREAVGEFARGNFETRVDIQSRDEIGALAQAFNDMSEALSLLEQNRRSFVADVSHELRTPLTTIGGFVEGMLDGTIAPGEQTPYLQTVLEETRRMTRMVNDLLYAEQCQNKKEALDATVFDINELLRRLLIRMEGQITAASLTVEAEFCDEVCPVLGEEDGIHRVLTNLLDNAIKFSPRDGILRVTVTEEGKDVRIGVENQGEPIPQSALGHLFDRFYKTDKSRGQNRSGVGLGLSIVKQILDRHHQPIRVTSDTEKTVFSFSLPRFFE